MICRIYDFFDQGPSGRIWGEFLPVALKSVRLTSVEWDEFCRFYDDLLEEGTTETMKIRFIRMVTIMGKNPLSLCPEFGTRISYWFSTCNLERTWGMHSVISYRQALKDAGHEEPSQPALVEEAAPVVEASQPVEEASQPVEEQPQPVEEPVQSVEEQPQPVEEALQPVEEPAQPVEEPSESDLDSCEITAREAAAREAEAREAESVVEPAQQPVDVGDQISTVVVMRSGLRVTFKSPADATVTTGP
jgi:hypothetical protein